MLLSPMLAPISRKTAVGKLSKLLMTSLIMCFSQTPVLTIFPETNLSTDGSLTHITEDTSRKYIFGVVLSKRLEIL